MRAMMRGLLAVMLLVPLLTIGAEDVPQLLTAAAQGETAMVRAMLDSAAAEHEVAIAQLAGQSGLSVRQLRHRFTQDLGVNPRAYLRWRRLRYAIDAITRGATLTQAALEAGFADSAHFSRVFHAQFGMSPSQGSSSVRFGGVLV